MRATLCAFSERRVGVVAYLAVVFAVVTFEKYSLESVELGHRVYLDYRGGRGNKVVLQHDFKYFWEGIGRLEQGTASRSKGECDIPIIRFWDLVDHVLDFQS